MKHTFEIGSDLLCFEPDETKEKLIYHARVIGHNGFETKGRNKVSLYLVHFLGWSKKWDRVVSEDLLLPASDFNKTLKAKIDLIAKTEKRHQIRHDLIDEVLDVASKVINEKKFNWDDLDEKLANISSQFKVEKKNEVVIVPEISVKEDSETEKSVVENGDMSDLENSLQKENDFIHATFSPKVSLTERQLDLLSLDKAINSNLVYPKLTSIEDIHKHSWNPCVVDILQNYMNAFPVADLRLPGWKEFDRFLDMESDGFLDRIENSPTSILDLSFDFNSDRHSSTKKQFKLPQWPDSELNSDYQRADLSSQLCFEVCSGLRIMFDFYTRHLLLYENEQALCDVIDDIIASSDTSSNQTWHMNADYTPFRLLPDEYRNHKHGFQPSLFFGLPHLLRLLYKLPSILVRMGLTRCSLAVVLRHCYSLIRFLDMSFSGQTAVQWRWCVPSPAPPTKLVSSDRHRRKRSIADLDHVIDNEPRIVLRRLVLSDGVEQPNRHHHSPVTALVRVPSPPHVIVTRSASVMRRK